LEGKIKPLKQEFNFFVKYGYNENLKNITVAHFIGSDKPWQFRPDNWLNGLVYQDYYKYWRESEFKNHLYLAVINSALNNILHPHLSLTFYPIKTCKLYIKAKWLTFKTYMENVSN